jgi:tRNA dimethylallyltransferase
MNPEPPVLVVTGTTASGKGDLGAMLAENLGGEVLSLDSMKVYRAMDIGTSKPTIAERRGVPHHLIDLVDPRESMNLARFVGLAEAARRDVAGRGRVPVAVGGTMMYLHGFLNGVFSGPVADPELRSRLRAEAEVRGVPALHERLRAVDPVAAQRIHPNDYKRIERALEVQTMTGRPISELQTRETRRPEFAREVSVVTFSRKALDLRIDLRVVQMFEAGFVDEVRRIQEHGGFGRESGEALGYREVVEHLQGRRGIEETMALVQRHTRQFARRQLTWLRRLEGAAWFELQSSDEFPATLAAIQSSYETKRRRTA